MFYKNIALVKLVLVIFLLSIESVNDNFIACDHKYNSLSPSLRLNTESNIQRLSLVEARNLLLDNLRVIKNGYPKLQQAISNGIEVLEGGDYDRFKNEAYPQIKAAADAFKPNVDNIMTIPAKLAFLEPETQALLDILMEEIARECNADKVTIMFSGSRIFYSYNFTQEQLTCFFSNINRSKTALLDKTSKDIWMKKDLLEVCDIKCAYEGGGQINQSFERVYIMVTRSEEYVRLYGGFEEEGAVKEKLKAYIFKNKEFFSSINDSIQTSGCQSFNNFLRTLKHNGGIEAILEEFVYVYVNIPNIMHRKKEVKSIISFLEYLKSSSKIVNNDLQTFLNIVENGTDLKIRHITQHLHERVLSFKQEIQGKGLEFLVELSEEDFVIDICDLNLLTLILNNLIQNAIKYTPKGKITVRLFQDKVQTINVFEPIDCVVLEVNDTGIGIPDEDISKIFKDGYRAANVGDIQGTGLGLKIVSSIVSFMRGKIRVESNHLLGSMFAVAFPLVEKKLAIAV